MNKNAEFLKLDTCDFMNDKVTHTVHTAESLGIRKYEPVWGIPKVSFGRRDSFNTWPNKKEPPPTRQVFNTKRKI